jgi:hypothetical protein
MWRVDFAVLSLCSGTVDSVASPVIWEVGAASTDNASNIEAQGIPQEWLGREVVAELRITAETRVYAFQFVECDRMVASVQRT